MVRLIPEVLGQLGEASFFESVGQREGHVLAGIEGLGRASAGGRPMLGPGQGPERAADDMAK